MDSRFRGNDGLAERECQSGNDGLMLIAARAGMTDLLIPDMNRDV